MNKIELLAPAGSYESLKAAYLAGADAVYAGGARFGARAYAENFTEDAFLDAIDYAHIHDKKLYLTLNTLLKEQELESQLYDFLAPLYEAGLDGVIIQDIGVFSYVRETFPGLPLHASTQMTVTGTDAACFLKKQGAARIIPARELSLDELSAIKKASGLELEVFIHGALCYCYSGLCFFSSLIGGRSGNRGRCAQPCRLPYEVNGSKQYYLSPRDLCGLSMIPALDNIGVDSLKIEGRMKNPLYTAGVVSVCRKYLDLYYERPERYKVEQRDMDRLMELYNRGGMTEGYFNRHNSGKMISAARPNHNGLIVGKGRFTKDGAVCTLSADVSKGDLLELRGPGMDVLSEFYSNAEKKAGTDIRVAFRGKAASIHAKGPLTLYRTKNVKIEEELKAGLDHTLSKPLSGRVILVPGKPAKLTIWDERVKVSVEGDQTEPAQNHPLSREDICGQLQKTGGTGFTFSKLDCEVNGDVFLPKQALNALRRQGLADFRQAFLKSFQRQHATPAGRAWVDPSEDVFSSEKTGYRLCVSAETEEQFFAAAAHPCISRIDIDSSLYRMEDEKSFLQKAGQFAACRRPDRKVYIRMPAVFRSRTRALFEKRMQKLAAFTDGFTVRNLDEYAYILEKSAQYPDMGVICDFTVYAFSKRAADLWKNPCGANTFRMNKTDCILTAPIELNQKELLENKGCYGEIMVYGRYPMMVSAGCIGRTNTWLKTGKDSCGHGENMLYLTDRYNVKFPVRQVCGDCYNVIYNSLPLYLADCRKELDRLHIPYLRLSFTTEDKEAADRIINIYTEVFLNDGLQKQDRTCLPAGSFTRGHFKRGVE